MDKTLKCIISEAKFRPKSVVQDVPFEKKIKSTLFPV